MPLAGCGRQRPAPSATSSFVPPTAPQTASYVPALNAASYTPPARFTTTQEASSTMAGAHPQQSQRQQAPPQAVVTAMGIVPPVAVATAPAASPIMTYPTAVCSHGPQGQQLPLAHPTSVSSASSSLCPQPVLTGGRAGPPPYTHPHGMSYQPPPVQNVNMSYQPPPVQQNTSYQPPPVQNFVAVPAQTLPNLAGVRSAGSSRCRSLTPNPERRLQPQNSARQITGATHALTAAVSWVPPPATAAQSLLTAGPVLHRPLPSAQAGSFVGLPGGGPSPTMPAVWARVAPDNGGNCCTHPSATGGVHQSGSSTLQCHNVDGDPETHSQGTEVAIGRYRFRCISVLGRGSFSEVWSGTILNGPEGPHQEVALKDVACHSRADLEQALLEVALLERFQHLAVGALGRPPVMRVPRYLAHKVDQRQSGWRVRLAMTRVPGESLDSFLRRPPPTGQDGRNCVRRGCVLAAQLILQLGPTLERIAPHAWHRDVNSRNVLLSDAIDGGRLRNSMDPDEMGTRASFWLIDFGLAVNSTTWQSTWPHADVAGDCRYWPPSSFLMSFYGPEETRAHAELCQQYQTRLDIAGLGFTALELLCSALLQAANAGALLPDSPWRRLALAWERYREEVTRWHTMIFQVFSRGGDVGPLYRQLGQERVVDKVAAHIAKIRSLLRACGAGVENALTHSLPRVVAELIDEKSSMGLREAIEALVRDGRPALHVEPLQSVSSYSYVPPLVEASVPVAMQQAASQHAPSANAAAPPHGVANPAAWSRLGGATTPPQAIATAACMGPEDAAAELKTAWRPPGTPIAGFPPQTTPQAKLQDLAGANGGVMAMRAARMRPRLAGA